MRHDLFLFTWIPWTSDLTRRAFCLFHFFVGFPFRLFFCIPLLYVLKRLLSHYYLGNIGVPRPCTLRDVFVFGGNL